MRKEIKGLYRDYKGQYYYVMGIATDKAKGKPREKVLYRKVIGMPTMKMESGKIVHIVSQLGEEFFTKDMDFFCGQAKINGGSVERFTRVDHVDESVELSA